MKSFFSGFVALHRRQILQFDDVVSTCFYW